MDSDVPRAKRWRHPRLYSEHAFDKLRLVDCTLAEFASVLDDAVVVEASVVEPEIFKEIVLLANWKRPLHAVVVVDGHRGEERIVTVYEPDPTEWTDGYRRRR